MIKHRFLFLLLLVFALAMGGCGNPATTSPENVSPEPVTVEDQDSLVAALEADGATVAPGDSIEQAFFSPVGHIIKVNGADVQVFEYASAEAMESEASLVAPDGGSIGTTMVTWVDAPHFYKAGRIIVLYVGSDQTIVSLLENVLGPQFAGR